MVRKLIIIIGIAVLLTMLDNKMTEPDNVKKPIERTWTIKDSKAYARDVLYLWADKQYECLNKLWTKESNWRPEAYNKNKVMGKNAGGIPQLLGMDPNVPAPLQIDRGIAYIRYRYTTPCIALRFHDTRGWY